MGCPSPSYQHMRYRVDEGPPAGGCPDQMPESRARHDEFPAFDSEPSSGGMIGLESSALWAEELTDELRPALRQTGPEESVTPSLPFRCLKVKLKLPLSAPVEKYFWRQAAFLTWSNSCD